jgi:hypothetical protein
VWCEGARGVELVKHRVSRSEAPIALKRLILPCAMSMERRMGSEGDGRVVSWWKRLCTSSSKSMDEIAGIGIVKD